MIEIKCNKTEKKKIIAALEVMQGTCLFPRQAQSCWMVTGNDCRQCLEKKIKWIENGSEQTSKH